MSVEGEQANEEAGAVDDTLLTGSNESETEGKSTDGDTTETEAPDAEGNTGDNVEADAEVGFTLPEGMEIPEDVVEATQARFNELGLTAEQQQGLVDFEVERSKTEAAEYDQLMMDWREQTTSDKEYGGDAFEQNQGIAQLAIAKLGTPELQQLLGEHGMGNHPEMFRFMWKVGKLMKEDNPGSGGDQTSPEKSAIDILYPK